MIDIEEKEPKVFDNEPKEITIEDAKNYFNAKYLDSNEVYDTGTAELLEAGARGFVGSLKKLPSSLRMAGGQAMYALGKQKVENEEYRQAVFPKGDMIFNGNLNVKLGEKLMESGKYNIITANRNLETLNREIQSEMPNLSEEDRNSWTMMIAEQGLDYGVMLGLSYINPTLGMGYMGTKIFAQETEEGAEAYKKKYGTIEGFEELSGDELALNVANVAVQEVFEKAFGAPAQLKRFKTMKDFGKAFFTGFGEEFLTENLQNVSDAVFDHIGKRLEEDETILTRIQDNFKGTLVAGMFGGTAGTAFAIHNRAQGINNFEKLLDGSDVPVEDRNALATDLYESGANNMQEIVTKELELNSQLRAKHGEIYDNMKKQIERQVRAAGAFQGKTEAEIAQYLEGTAKQFADNVLAEAQKRNTLIDDVVNSNDIVFEKGKLLLAPKIITVRERVYNPGKMSLLTYLKYKGGLKDVGGDLKAMDAGKQFIGLINNKSGRSLDDAAFDAWESGYFPQFPERPTVNDLLNAISTSLMGKRIYREDYRTEVAEKEQRKRDEFEAEGIIDSFLSGFFTDEELAEMTQESKERIYKEYQEQSNAITEEEFIQQEFDALTESEQERYVIMRENGSTHEETIQNIKNNRNIKDIFELYQESMDIAEENARLDDIYPAYEGETININGQEKTVYNSNGDRIAKSKEALQNFYRWFGDSKVVDKQGRPLVVYHGTGYEFDTFDTAKRGGNTGNRGFYGDGFYLTDRESEAKFYAQQSVIDRFTSRIFGNMGYEKVQQFIADKSVIMNVYASLKNPLIWKDIKTEKEAKALSKKIGMRLEWNDRYKQINHIRDDKKSIKFAEKLKQAGYDGVIYTGDNGSEIVAFESNQIKSTSNRGTYSESENIYYQSAFAGKKGKIKGAFDKLTKSIRITKDADFSTYQHELAHFWLDNIWDYVNSGKASAEYKKQFEELKKWLGVKPNQSYFTRAQHEKFARGYEKFLFRGKAVNPIIASAFDDYEKFIREVYDNITEIDVRAGKEYEPLSREAYNFFNSMVSGELTPPANLPNETIEQARETVAKSETDAEEVVAEETKTLEENRANYKLEPVKTDTKTSYLTAYEKMTGEKVEAGVAELDKEMAKANEFVANNLELAEKIVNGEAPAPENMLKNTIYLAYQEMQKKLGNTEKRANALLNQAQELRAYGQEIASQKLAYADQSTPLYWLSRVMSARAESIAEGNKMTASELQDYINKEIRPAIGDEKAVENVVKTLAENLGIRELYQTEKVDFSTKDGVYKYVTSKLGIIPTQEQTAEIIKRADDMLNNLKNAQTNGNPTVDYFVKYKDLENYANSIAPSSNLRVLVSVVGKGNLLASFKSPTTNIVANMPVAGLQAALRRQKLGVTKSIVDAELIKQNKKQSWEIYRKTGYTLNNMTDVSPKGMTLGERITQSQGEGAIRKLGRIYENVIYKWSLGAPDLLFKDFAFNDYVSLAATKESGGDVAKANEIYKDAIRIMPTTELGQEIRQAAIEDSLIATYQNNGKISEAALKIRKSLDFGVGFGEFIAPFVKTPANVVGMGLDTAFGGVRALTSEIIRDVKAGKVLTPKSENVRLVVQNGLGLLVASLLLGAIDDDDYMPSYSLATNRDKQIAKELNIPFNSIRIGNTWFSMDYLGPLASPLMGLLQARRENGIINSVMGYVKSGAIQTLSIPAFGNVGDLNEKISNIVRKDGVDALENVASQAIEATVARAVPSIVSDISKMLDENDREAKTLKEKLQAKTPLLREELPERYNVTTGKAMPRAENTVKRLLIDLFAGARVKEQVVNNMADELFRLNTKGYGASLTDVTRSGLLSQVSSEKKALIKKDFAQMYSKGVKELIKTYRYKKADDEDKKDMIDSLRRKYVKELKNKYLKKAKR